MSYVVKYVDVVMVFRHSSPEIVIAQLILFSLLFYGASNRVQSNLPLALSLAVFSHSFSCSLCLSLSPVMLSIPKHTKIDEAFDVQTWQSLAYAAVNFHCYILHKV